MRNLIAAAILLAGTPASAAEMKLTVKEASAALAALNKLSAGTMRVVKEHEQERVVTTPFDLSADAKVAIAKNISRLRLALAPKVEEFRAIAKAVCPDDAACDGDAKQKLDAEGKKIDKSELPIDLVVLTDNDLALSKNAISPDTLADLGQIAPWAK